MSTHCFISAILVLLTATDGCHSLSHRVGNDQLTSVALHEQNLFSRNATIARNYTIAYKYSNVGIMGVIDFVQIDVLGAQQTNASISFVGDTNVLQHRRVNATVRIQNATDFVSSVRIMGQPGFRFDDFWVSNNLFALYEQRLMKARSSALICTERIRDELRGKNRVFEFGNRGAADFLVYFQSGLGVANKLQRPEFTFDFQDTQVNITYLALTSSSPWAIVLHNKMLLSENQFHATLYGLDKKSFTTELIIYGIRN